MEGFVDRDRAAGTWMLGPEFYLLGLAARKRYDVRGLVQPHVRALAQLTAESAFYSARRGDETVCLVHEEGSFPIRSHVLHEGARFPLGVVSAGLVVLAYLSDSEISTYLSRSRLEDDYGPAHESSALRSRISEVRQSGWALNPGLVVEGSWGMAAAVFDAEDQPVGALTLTGIEARFALARRTELGSALLREAHRVTMALRKPPW